MTEDTKNELIKFAKVKNNTKKKRNIFFKWKAEILFLKNKRVTLQDILHYIFMKDSTIKLKYENRTGTAINIISRITIKNKFNKKQLTKLKEKEILEYINTIDLKKSHSLAKWQQEIFFLKTENIGLRDILEYLLIKDPQIKEKYKGREATAKALLSAFIKRYYKKDENNFTKDSKKTINNTIEDSSSEKVKDEVVKEKFLDNESSILIEHIDGSNGNYKHDYLMSECVCKSGSSKKFDLMEKNFIVVPSVRQKVIYYFEKVKNNIREGKYELKDYELVIHINIEKDSGLDVYRYYNGELIFIEEVHSFDAGHLDDILEFGIEKFIGIQT